MSAALHIAQLGVWEFTAPVGGWQYDPVLAAAQFDSRCRELFGLPDQGAMTISDMLGLVHPDDREQVREQLHLALGLYGTGVFETECRILRPDGTERFVAMRANRIRQELPASRLVQFVGTVMDITDRKRTQELLVRSEKVAVLGRMAATLAHEINNPLAAVVNTLFLARSVPDCSTSVNQYLDIAEEHVRQICHITRQALGFYRESSTPTQVDIQAVVDETVGLFKGRIKGRNVVVDPAHGEKLRVLAVSGELRQVFSNLVANSLDAVGENGSIRIRVAQVRALGNGAARIRITVADDGKGIESSSMPHLFEPLYTTKGAVGTGLGLWVSKQIIEKYGGSIRVRSSSSGQHRGTTFSILLPAIAHTAEPVNVASMWKRRSAS